MSVRQTYKYQIVGVKKCILTIMHMMDDSDGFEGFDSRSNYSYLSVLIGVLRVCVIFSIDIWCIDTIITTGICGDDAVIA